MIRVATATHHLHALVVRRELLEGQVHRGHGRRVALESSCRVEKKRDQPCGDEGLDVVIGSCHTRQTTTNSRAVSWMYLHQ